MAEYKPPICTCGGAKGAVRAANHWHSETVKLRAENKELRSLASRFSPQDEEAMGIIRRAAALLRGDEAERVWTVVNAARKYKAMVTDAMAHQAGCEDSPCDACSEQMKAEDDAMTALFVALGHLND